MDCLKIDKSIIKADPLTMALYLEPARRWYWFHEQIARLLMDPNEIRIAISLPAQHFKSSLVMKWVLWLVGNKPDDEQVSVCSYSGDLAKDHNSECLTLVESKKYQELFGVEPSTRKFTAEQWGFKGHSSRVRAVGVGGSLFGKPTTTLVLDDLVKPTDAYSDAINKHADKWYKGEALTRLKDEKSKIVYIGSRIGEDDFIGKRLRNKKEHWTYLNIPAIGRPDNLYEAQPIGELEKGKPLMKSMNFYLSMFTGTSDSEDGITSAEFEAQFQGCPTPRGSLFLHSSEVEIVESSPWKQEKEIISNSDSAKTYVRKFKAVRGWDIAWTSTSNSDESASALLTRADQKYFVECVEAYKQDYSTLKKTVKRVIIEDGRGVIQVIETNGGGEALLSDLRNDPELAGYTVIGKFSKDSKHSRAYPWVLRAKDKKVVIVKGAWNIAFFDELNHFTEHSKKDNMIDAVSKSWEIISNILVAP